MASNDTKQKRAAEAVSTSPSQGYYKTYEIFRAGAAKFFARDHDADLNIGPFRSLKALKAEVDKYLGDGGDFILNEDNLAVDPAIGATINPLPFAEEVFTGPFVEDLEPELGEAGPGVTFVGPGVTVVEEIPGMDEVVVEDTPEVLAEVVEPVMIDTTDRVSMESLALIYPERFEASHTALSNVALQGTPLYIAPKSFASWSAAESYRTPAGGPNLIQDTRFQVGFMLVADGAGGAEWLAVSPEAVAEALAPPVAVVPKAAAAVAEAEAAAKATVKPYSMPGYITLLVDGNPKTPGSNRARRYANYVTGMSCVEALKAGCRKRDLVLDARKGYIAITATKPVGKAVHVGGAHSEEAVRAVNTTLAAKKAARTKARNIARRAREAAEARKAAKLAAKAAIPMARREAF